MAGLSFRDRFFTPPVARALTSPVGIVLAGVVAAVLIVVGVSIPVAIVLGVVAWAARVLWAVPRAPRRERIDPFTLHEPWRRFVQEALQAHNRFDEVVARTRAGPLRDNLSEVASRIQAVVEECWQVARRGDTLQRARSDIDLAAIDSQLAAIGPADGADASTLRVIESLQAQRATAERLDRVIAEAGAELRMLDARLDEAVVRTIELSAQANADASLGSLSTDVEGLVTEMEALRQAMDETSQVARPQLGRETGGEVGEA